MGLSTWTQHMKVSLLSDSSTAPYGEYSISSRSVRRHRIRPSESLVAPNASGDIEESVIENAA